MGAHAGCPPAISRAIASRPWKFFRELSPGLYGVQFETVAGGGSLSGGGGEIESVFIGSLAVPRTECLPPQRKSACGAALAQGHCTRRTQRRRRSQRYPEGLPQSRPDPYSFRKSRGRGAIL